MPAHLREISRPCDRLLCDKTAVVQLFNTWNAPLGVYCRPHGNQALKEHQAAHESGQPATGPDAGARKPQEP